MHEELEKYERVIALDLAQDTKSHRERLAQSHRVANTIQQISQRATKLVRAPPHTAQGWRQRNPSAKHWGAPSWAWWHTR